ncbi:jg23254 [Pararge aegeria aegeria]|uniref:Jg23254 protein n=1 Tax=Pararge aegeria aegeria TaxID=348720 RepID=A0A8S4QM48_9NEOP|nr:jg23254 [Pararge aegeria aegeria]
MVSTISLERILEYFGGRTDARKGGESLEKLVVTGKVEGKGLPGRSPMRWSAHLTIPSYLRCSPSCWQ